MDPANIKIAVEEFAQRLRNLPLGKIIKVILFGSAVRGEAKSDSDIDVLVVIDKNSWELKKLISDIAAEINLKYDVVLSTVRYPKDLWNKPAVKSSPFIRNVLSEGVVL